MNARAVRLTEVDIDNALEKAHLEVVFQPIFALSGRRLLRYEAFVRWDHPGLGSLPPGAFISFFETQGRIGDLTRYVLRHAITSLLSDEEANDGQISINLTLTDLRDPSLPHDMQKILNEFNFAPDRLVLECPVFPPGVPVDEQSACYQRLTEIGCSLSVEVRSRATEELQELSPFPFHEIKTGGASILRQARQGRGGPGMAALSELLAFAKSQNSQIIAVGVEDEDAVVALEALGFDGAQGNALGRIGTLGTPTLDQIESDLPTDDPSSAEQQLIEDEDPSTTDPLDLSTAEADQTTARKARQARVIAAKKAALKRFHAAREATQKAKEDEAAKRQSAEERAAAILAANTARQLQDRLEKSFGDDLSPQSLTENVSVETVPVGLTNPELGIGIAQDFSEGIRLDGYSTRNSMESIGSSTMAGAVAMPIPQADPLPDLVSTLEHGTGPVGIGAILDALPDDISLRNAPTAPEPTIEAEPDQSAVELDEAVAASPQLPHDLDEELENTEEDVTVSPAVRQSTGYPDWMPEVLTRKYRITHFWPRSWKRSIRQWKMEREFIRLETENERAAAEVSASQSQSA